MSRDEAREPYRFAGFVPFGPLRFRAQCFRCSCQIMGT